MKSGEANSGPDASHAAQGDTPRDNRGSRMALSDKIDGRGVRGGQ